MTTPDQPGRAAPPRRGRTAIRIILLSLTVAAMLFLATTSWLSGR